MVKGMSFALAGALLAISATAAQAQSSGVIAAANPAGIVRQLKAAGFGAELEKDRDGNPLIRSSVGEVNFDVYFYDCTKGTACGSFQFTSGWTKPTHASLSDLNQWNRENRFGRAYLSTAGSAYVEYDINTAKGGMSVDQFADELDLWVTVLDSFSQYIYAK